MPPWSLPTYSILIALMAVVQCCISLLLKLLAKTGLWGHITSRLKVLLHTRFGRKSPLTADHAPPWEPIVKRGNMVDGFNTEQLVADVQEIADSHNSIAAQARHAAETVVALPTGYVGYIDAAGKMTTERGTLDPMSGQVSHNDSGDEPFAVAKEHLADVLSLSERLGK